jgi:hypothetical protein
MKITKGMTIKVLLISYKYTDKSINPRNLGNTIKNYYENNSRNTVTINLTSVAYKVPFTSKQFNQAIDYVKKIMPKGYDVNVHFCNPGVSHTGGGNVITWASTTNAVHEFGHACGLGHANSLLSGKTQHCRDPFDQMTIFAPYPSTNAVHRYQLNWFLDGELVKYDPTQPNYTIGMLKNFADKQSAKVVLYTFPSASDPTNIRKFFVSYGAKKGVNYVTLHTIIGPASSFIIGMWAVVKDKTVTNAMSGLTIKMNGESGVFPNNVISLTITTQAPLQVASDPTDDQDEDCNTDSGIDDVSDGVSDDETGN